MRIRTMAPITGLLALNLAALTAMAAGPRLYVCPVTGDDDAPGTARNAPVATVSAALERAAPGTVVTLLPGWHAGGIVLPPGAPGQPVTLQGARPGRVFVGRPAEIISGWLPAPGFEYTYRVAVAEVPRNLMESSTGPPMRPMPSPRDVEHLAGTFHYAEAEGRIYLHPSDSESARRHLYSVPTPEGTGIRLANHVMVKDLVITGMGDAAMIGNSVSDVEVRNCLAYGNGYALRLNGVDDARIQGNHFRGIYRRFGPRSWSARRRPAGSIAGLFLKTTVFTVRPWRRFASIAPARSKTASCGAI